MIQPLHDDNCDNWNLKVPILYYNYDYRVYCVQAIWYFKNNPDVFLIIFVGYFELYQLDNSKHNI